jgi:RNA polymerase sigma-70 factor, ECF subfamily
MGGARYAMRKMMPWRDLVVGEAPAGEAEEAAAVLEEMLVLAHVEHPPDWVAPDAYVAAALARAGRDTNSTLASRLRNVRAADLYFALGCARGRRDALERFEREHMARVGDFIARIDRSPAVADEVRQRLRARLLAASGTEPPRIVTYSARGSLGGWLRVCAVREARALIGEDGGARKDLDRAVAEVDPEAALLKEKYGAIVSDAFRQALAGLDAPERAMLRMHYVEGATLEQVAAVMRVSRATGARALAKARAELIDAARRHLKAAVGADTVSAQSLIAFVRSRIELDLAKHLDEQS